MIHFHAEWKDLMHDGRHTDTEGCRAKAMNTLVHGGFIASRGTDIWRSHNWRVVVGSLGLKEAGELTISCSTLCGVSLEVNLV